MDKQIVISRLREHAEEIRRRFLVRNLSVFGSFARDEATDSSDVDVLVSFDRPATFDIFMDLKFYLEELLGKGVDLVTDKALRPQLRKSIQEELINVA
jgi:predicted nucleotidyltransferase